MWEAAPLYTAVAAVTGLNAVFLPDVNLRILNAFIFSYYTHSAAEKAATMARTRVTPFEVTTRSGHTYGVDPKGNAYGTEIPKGCRAIRAVGISPDAMDGLDGLVGSDSYSVPSLFDYLDRVNTGIKQGNHLVLVYEQGRMYIPITTGPIETLKP